ncbi:MAG: hypothetical protein H8E31_13780 [Planctomycetes bacterium]|nr:hypothetical protein [Planctomycetota bacterium]
MPAWIPLPRTLAACALLAAAVACSSVPLQPLAQEQDGAEAGEVFNALVGMRRMERGSDWSPNDDLGQVGLNYLQGGLGSPWRWDFGLRYAADQAKRSVAGAAESLETHLVDLSVGPLLLIPGWARGFQPYAGAGVVLAWMDSDFRRKGVLLQDQDGTLGVYARGGFWLDFQPHEHIGLDLMWIGAGEADFAGEARRSHSWTVSLLFGYRF